jgi:gamma-glutamyl:cysteine ligase YbdK (ATP-grasp superfamily)
MIKFDLPTSFSRTDRRRYRQKVLRSLDAFALMLDHFRFDEDKRMIGLEIEIDMVDAKGDPAMCNAEFLTQLDDPGFKAELGAFNLELNVRPRLIGGTGLGEYERELRASLNAARAVADRMDLQLVLTGILPTIAPTHTVPQHMSDQPRYHALNEQIIDSRGDDITVDIRGEESVRVQLDSMMGESANTSIQVHLQVTPASFASYWNASQAIAGVQVALAANSPFLYGRRLWDETRIPLFEQAVDERPAELRNQGIRPRVWFGERWVTSIFDLFEENVRYFGALLPACDDEEEPDTVVAAGSVPKLFELRLLNGTIYRWNRPVYDISDGVPHLRVENRVLAAGPTVLDMCANAAFYAGLTRTLAEADRPVWSQLSFASAKENFLTAARYGINATLFWPQRGESPVTELVLGHLLPAAHTGLDSLGVDPSTRDRLLGVIEGRCQTGRNGAVWQTRTVARLESQGRDRVTALREMLNRYVSHMQTNEPVHMWPLD